MPIDAQVGISVDIGDKGSLQASGHDLFTAFNFIVEITLPGESGLICKGGFAECDGLEMSMAPKTLREGGNNNRMHHLAGPVSYGQLTLKRGMTDSLDLWEWFTNVNGPDGNNKGRAERATAEVVMLSSDHREALRFKLDRCVPIKIKAPALSAKDGMVAVEEFQLAYERLAIKKGSGK